MNMQTQTQTPGTANADANAKAGAQETANTAGSPGGIRAWIQQFREGKAKPEMPTVNTKTEKPQPFVETPDPKVGLEKLSSLNFMQLAGAEDLQKAFAEQDTTAFANAMNRVFAGSQMLAMQSMAPLIENAVRKAVEQMGSSVDSRLQQKSVEQLIKERYGEDEALYSVAKLYSTHFLDKFPEASPAEIDEAVSVYMDSIKSAFQPKAEPSPAKDGLAKLFQDLKGA